MAKGEFSVDLGGGLYMDSNGVLSRGADPAKPVYATPGGGLPIKPETIEKVFTGIKKALPDRDDPKSRAKFDKILDGIGMKTEDKENLMGVLQSLGKVAGTIASVVPYVGAVFAILNLFGLFKEGPSALEELFKRRADDLERLIRGLEKKIKLTDVRNERNKISRALSFFADYANELRKAVPNASALAESKRNIANALNDIDGVDTAVRNLLHTSTWLGSFDQGEHTWVWPFIQNRLFTFPKTGSPHRAVLPAHDSLQFDHRYMVPMVTFAVESYLTLKRAVTPEFRSTREGRQSLVDFAGDLEILAENLRDEGLARTVYTPADFVIPWGLSPEEVIDFTSLGLPAFVSPGCTRFAVGALDLRSHNNSYFTPGFTTSFIQFPAAQYAKQGILNARWTPPAILERYEETIPTVGPESRNRPPATRTRYRITNPEQCAAAANAQSEQDYTDLLFSSGYLNLIHLIATLRNEATDPDQSQTVRSSASLMRRAGPSVPVTVTSEPIPLSDPITSAAERRTMEFGATLDFTTQPLDRVIKLPYRVYLRTLPEGRLFGNFWSEDRYKDYHQVRYTTDPADSHLQKLVTSTGIALDELMLVQGTTSAEPRVGSGTVKLTAVTFDWWIPVKPPSYLPSDRQALDNVRALRALGWSPQLTAPSPDLNPAPSGANRSDPFGIRGFANSKVRSVTWEDSKEPVTGLHRKEAKTEIELDYSFQWHGDRLTVSITNNRPSDRNYVVYVVVEETLVSGEVLHTVERVPVVGALTFVPQSYFDAEQEAIARAIRALRDFARSYVISVSDIPRPGDPDPGDLRFDKRLAGLPSDLVTRDPILRSLQLENFTTVAAMEQMIATAVRHEPAAALLRLSLREAEVPDSVVRSLFRKHGVPNAKGKTKASGNGNVRGKRRGISLAAKIVKTEGLRLRSVKIGHVK